MSEADTSSTIGKLLPDPGASTGASSSSAVASEQVPISTAAQSKAQQNAAILQATLDVSIQSKNQPLALLLKSAITGINDLLKPQFGANAIQAAASQDNTPTGTADRIVSLSTGFFEAFKQQNTGEDANAQLSKFMATIRSGFEKGAKEAQGILKGMGVLKGEIASNIDQTLALVEQGYAKFEAQQRDQLAAATSADTPV